MEPTFSDYQALLKRDFYAFIQRCFHELNGPRPFLPNWHLEVLASRLEACRQGKVKRLIVNVPPRHLKSLSASIALPAWFLGHDPTAQVVCVSYAQDLSDSLSRQCRSVMTSDWYKNLFTTRLSPLKQSAQELATNQGGCRLATSIGGSLMGRGADIIIIDDPLKPEEALSDTQRHNVNEWYDSTLYGRLNDKNTGCIILVMQRLHQDDLVNHVLSNEEWEVLSFPAIAQKDEEYSFDTIGGRQIYTCKAGEVLHAAHESKETLDRIRNTVGEYIFDAQYQQAPPPAGGRLIRTEWFKHYSPGDLPQTFEQVVQSWDTANTISETSDFSVCTTWGVSDQNLYLLEVLRARMKYPALRRAAREQLARYCPTAILIENKASGTQLIQDLVRDGFKDLIPCMPENSKAMRVNEAVELIRQGRVLLPENAPWLQGFLKELSSFPDSQYKDQVDSTSQALGWIEFAPPEPTFLVHSRLQKARVYMGRGLSLEDAASEAQLAPEKLRQMLQDLRQSEENALQKELQRRRKNCHRCHKPITTSKKWEIGELFYHMECHDGCTPLPYSSIR